MRIVASAVLAATLLALTGPPARAGSGSTHLGGCGWSGLHDVPGAVVDGYGEWHGTFEAAFVLTSTEPADHPVSATVTCDLFSENGLVLSWSASGTGVIVDRVPIAFTATDPRLYLCETVDYTSDGTPTSHVCTSHNSVQYPAYELIELAQLVTRPYEPVLCPLLASLQGGTGGLWIDEEGDVRWNNGSWLYDCPPQH